MISFAPAVSVVIRAYNRPAALIELLEAILQQDHPSFEVIIVDQTSERNELHAIRLQQIADDPRVRLLTFPPLGGARARNEGSRAARGAILLFIDDDDLPANKSWVSAHASCYEDPRCLVVTGRSRIDGAVEPSPAYMRRARRNVLSLVPIVLWQRVYVRCDRRRRVQSAHGTNMSVRRSVLEKIGLWDECTSVEDEMSFCYRLRAKMASQEYLLFEPEARIIRRLDLPGGLDKRGRPMSDYGWKVFTFQHEIIGHYFPLRFLGCYPAFVIWTLFACLEWLWEAGNRRYTSISSKMVASLWFTAAFPFLWTWWLTDFACRRFIEGTPEHAPKLHT